MREVVITGHGLRTPLGSQIEAVFDALLSGRSGVQTFPEWDEIDELYSRVGARVSNLNPKELPRKFRRSMGRSAVLAVLAAKDAVATAGLTEEELSSGRIGVVAGSTVGSSQAEEEFWQKCIVDKTTHGLKPTLFFRVMSHTCAANIAMFLKVSGETISTNAACATSTQAIGMALDRIRFNRADAVLAGGGDELHVAAVMTFDGMSGSSRGYNDRPHLTPRPFDGERDGIVVGEGGAVVVVEERERATSRGATILADVLGYGGSSDGTNMAAPSTEGIKTAISLALEDARLKPEDIDYICAHATGTPLGDAAEAQAIYDIFGRQVPVSSTKGNLGHMLGACGAAEAIISIEAMRRGIVPPTLNLGRPDVAPIWLPTEPLPRKMRHIMSTNFAFGGVNTALILGNPNA